MVLKGKRRGKVDRGSDTGQVPTVDWATPSIRDTIPPRPKSATSATSRNWFPSGVPYGKNAIALHNEQFLPDSTRFDFCVPALGQQKENLAMFNAGKRPTDTMRAPGCPR